MRGVGWGRKTGQGKDGTMRIADRKAVWATTENVGMECLVGEANAGSDGGCELG